MSRVPSDREPLSKPSEASAISSAIPPWPNFEPDERAAVDAALSSGKVNYWTGEQGRLFESEYAQWLRIPHAIALMNGTVALELSLRLWGIGTGDEVIVTPRSFVASASCAVLLGARAVFADVDRDSGNLTAATIERVLTPKTKAIVLVHLGGWPCEMDEIMALASRHGLKVLEDCAQAHGATFRERHVGTLGHAGAFSFCQDKIITTGGEGGLLALDDEELWSKGWAFKDHGKSYETVYRREHALGFRWLHESFGTNWRMTELQAAIGRIQLRKLDEWSRRRRANARLFVEELKDAPVLRIPQPAVYMQHAYYRFYAYVEPAQLREGWSRDRIVAEVNGQGVPCFTGSCSEMYLEKAFKVGSMHPYERLPIARELGETSLAFLVHPTLEARHIRHACGVIRAVLARAAR